MKNKLYPALIMIFLFWACSEDDGPGLVPTPVEDLDVDLTTLMGDPDFFILPESDDFANIPQDPMNPITAEKVELGKLLFHETATGSNPKLKNDYGSEGTYSCASCHHVAAGFRAGQKQGLSEGGVGFGLVGEARHLNPKYEDYLDSIDVQPVRSPTAMNTAFQDVMLWNGQFGATGTNAGTETSWTAGTPKAKNILGFQGLEIQAIAAQDVHRLLINETLLNTYPEYKEMFDAAYGTYETDHENIKILAGLAIAAYERTLLSTEAPFQKYLKGDQSALTDEQKRGAILFFGKAKCVQCHTGPALNSMAFHALGINKLTGFSTFLTDGDKPVNLGRGGFTNNPDDNYKFKVPQLYNLKDDDFFGHGSTFTSVHDVVEYKNQAVPENTEVPSEQLAAEFVPLGLTSEEVDQLTAFLEDALYDDNLIRYVPEKLPSGFFFPVNDPESQGSPGIMGGPQ